MEKIMRVTQVHAHRIGITGMDVTVAAAGEVSTSGWTNPQLSPYVYITPPPDGYWEFDFIADRPDGPVIEVILPVSACFTGPAPEWLKGVRIYAATNTMEVPV